MSKVKIINHSDVIGLSKLVDTNEQLFAIQNYLKDNDLEIRLVPCHDSQSGWSGESVMLEGVDLSGNGYCYSTSRLMEHILTHKRYSIIKDTKEYKNYLILHEKYKNIPK